MVLVAGDTTVPVACQCRSTHQAAQAPCSAHPLADYLPNLHEFDLAHTVRAGFKTSFSFSIIPIR
jgi:hypothetical protein